MSEFDQARNICFTCYADPPAWHEKWKTCDLPRGVKYLVYQMEECPSTKRAHIQGYAESSAPKKYSAWQKCLEIGKSHMEPRRGTAEQASVYCTDKGTDGDGKPKIILLPHVVRGEMSSQGKRKDLEAICDEIKTGATMQEMQRYKGQKTIIFDEFMGNTPVGEMNSLIDKTPLTFNVKGTDAICKAETIVITTNKRWRDMYGDAVGGTNPGWERRMQDPRITTHIHEDDPRLQQAIDDELAEVASTRGALQRVTTQVVEVILTQPL